MPSDSLDRLVNADPKTKPRMPRVQQFPKLGPVGVLKPCCTTRSAHTAQSAKRHRLAGLSEFLCEAGIPHACTKRSLNMTANCVFASAHSRGGRFHSAAAWFRARYSSFAAALSEGKCPLVLTARRSFEFNASIAFVTGMRIAVPAHPAGTALVLAYGATIRDEGHREHVSGQADPYDEPRARVSSWPPLRPTRLRRERGSVVVVWPTAPVEPQEEEQEMQRVIGMDIHRTFAEVVFWEAGRLRPGGRVDMTRSGLEGFGRSLSKEDEVVVEATGNAMAVVRVLARMLRE